MVRSRAVAASTFLILIAMLSACARGQESDSTESPVGADATGTSSEGHEATEGPAELIPVRVGALSFASVTLPFMLVMEDQGIAEANGLDLEVRSFGDVAAYYGALASGEVDVNVSGPTNLQNMRNEGVPIRGLATAVALHGGVFTTDPDVESLKDLEGKSLAALSAISTYQFLAIYANSIGLDLTSDVTVVNADATEAQAQLLAGRVDAAMSWEPSASLLRDQVDDARQIYEPREAWRELSGGLEGWEILVVAREDWLGRYGDDGVDKVIAAFKEAAEFIQTNPEEAGRIFEEATDFPGHLYADAVKSERLVHVIEPVWEGQHQEELEFMFKAAVDAGYIDELPDSDVLYRPSD